MEGNKEEEGEEEEEKKETKNKPLKITVMITTIMHYYRVSLFFTVDRS